MHLSRGVKNIQGKNRKVRTPTDVQDDHLNLSLREEAFTGIKTKNKKSQFETESFHTELSLLLFN